MEKTGEAFDCLLGERIALFRNKRDLSQRALGDLLGRNKSYIERIEAGRTSITMYSLICLCTILDVRLEELIADNTASALPVRVLELYRIECDSHGVVAEFGDLTDAMSGVGAHVRFLHNQ